MLHDPVYRTTYAKKLKQKLPRVPYTPTFTCGAGGGQAPD